MAEINYRLVLMDVAIPRSTRLLSPASNLSDQARKRLI
jgi:hypothetical protein